ncbi:MAG: hypothetical protein ACI9CQ_003612 [Saprospiraceae bacterium]|jgi:hypothetical protein
MNLPNKIEDCHELIKALLIQLERLTAKVNELKFKSNK